MRTITLTLPMPPKELSPNYAVRCHWAAKARAKNKHNEAVYAAAYGMEPSAPFGKCRIDVTAYTTRQMDCDNLIASLKVAIDTLCRMGFISNDKHVSWGAVESVYGGKKVVGERRVELVLTELES